MSDTSQWTTRELAPFGLEVAVPLDVTWDNIPPDDIHRWVEMHRIVVLRGLPTLGKMEMTAAARKLGPLHAWEFGAVNELHEKNDTENYLYTSHAVPLHWDGAFVGKVP